MSYTNRPTDVRVHDQELVAQALDLRLGGTSYRGIATAQGCSVATAHDRVQRALAQLVPTDQAEQLRAVENERLNAAVTACLEVMAGTQTVTIEDREVTLPYSADERLAAVGRLTKLSERIAKLNGLDIPVVQRLEVTTVDRLDEQIEQLMEELGRTGEGAAPGPPPG